MTKKDSHDAFGRDRGVRASALVPLIYATAAAEVDEDHVSLAEAHFSMARRRRKQERDETCDGRASDDCLAETRECGRRFGGSELCPGPPAAPPRQQRVLLLESDRLRCSFPPALLKLLLLHQVTGVRFLVGHLCGAGRGCLLGDYMGLGKTMQCIAAASLLLATGSLRDLCKRHILAFQNQRCMDSQSQDRKAPDVRRRVVGGIRDAVRALRIVVVAPCGVIPSWLDEISRFSNAIIKHGPSQLVSGSVHCATLHSFDESWLSSAAPSELPFELPSDRRSSWVFHIVRSTVNKSAVVEAFHRLGGVMVVPYSQLVLETLSGLQMDVVFLDEGHRIRNADTQITRFFEACPTPLRVVVSGYPLQNQLIELHRLLAFATCGAICERDTGIGDEAFFIKHYAIPLQEVFLKQPPDERESSAERHALLQRERERLRSWAMRRAALLFERTAPYVIRRGLHVLNALNGSSRSIYHVSLCPSTAQVLAYNAVVEALADSASSTSGKRLLSLDMHVVGTELCGMTLSRIRSGKSEGVSALSAARRVISERRNLFDDSAVPPKLKFLWAAASALKRKGKKLIAFSQFHSILDEVVAVFSQLQQLNGVAVRVARCDGLMPVEERVKTCAQFLDEVGSIDVLLFSLRAGCEGLNLRGASMVVSLDVSYNPAVEHEAFARAFRIGQRECVDVVVLTTSGTTEERRYELQCGKQQLVDLCVDGCEVVAPDGRSNHVTNKTTTCLLSAHDAYDAAEVRSVSSASVFQDVAIDSLLIEILPLCTPYVRRVVRMSDTDCKVINDEAIGSERWDHDATDRHPELPGQSRPMSLAQLGAQDLCYELTHGRRRGDDKADFVGLSHENTAAQADERLKERHQPAGMQATDTDADDDEFDFSSVGHFASSSKKTPTTTNSGAILLSCFESDVSSREVALDVTVSTVLWRLPGSSVVVDSARDEFSFE